VREYIRKKELVEDLLNKVWVSYKTPSKKEARKTEERERRKKKINKKNTSDKSGKKTHQTRREAREYIRLCRTNFHTKKKYEG